MEPLSFLGQHDFARIAPYSRAATKCERGSARRPCGCVSVECSV